MLKGLMLGLRYWRVEELSAKYQVLEVEQDISGTGGHYRKF